MEQRVSLVTLVVADVGASRRFYVDGLGWTPMFEAPGEVLMFQVADKVLLSLWDRDAAQEELGDTGELGGAVPITLAHNVATKADVDAVLDDARAAGAPTVQPALERDWGGYSGYFADPDGFRWEVAYNPTPIGEAVL